MPGERWAQDRRKLELAGTSEPRGYRAPEGSRGVGVSVGSQVAADLPRRKGVYVSIRA